MIPKPWDDRSRCFVFLGEAGCGKSEIALNLALCLAEAGERVRFFDLDMTKPLFRSRDLSEPLREKGIDFRFEEQFYDAPTLVGGVRSALREEGLCTILDIGGDYIGARSVGAFAPLLTAVNAQICYIVNPYRPWSLDIEHISAVLSQILGASHLPLESLLFLANPNLGIATTAEDVLRGFYRAVELLSPYVPVRFLCARDSLCASLPKELAVFPLRLQLSYPWEDEEI